MLPAGIAVLRERIGTISVVHVYKGKNRARSPDKTTPFRSLTAAFCGAIVAGEDRSRSTPVPLSSRSSAQFEVNGRLVNSVRFKWNPTLDRRRNQGVYVRKGDEKGRWESECLRFRPFAGQKDSCSNSSALAAPHPESTSPGKKSPIRDISEPLQRNSLLDSLNQLRAPASPSIFYRASRDLSKISEINSTLRPLSSRKIPVRDRCAT